MYEKLEKVATIEQTFEEQQEPLILLEKKEKEIYNKIIELGMKHSEEVKSLAIEATEIVEKRKEHIENERKSLEASKEEFLTTSSIIDEMEEKKLQEIARKLYKTMNNRYSSYDKMYKNYLQALKLDHDLYNKLQNKNAQIKELQNLVTEINQLYIKINEENEMFNSETKRYNEIKVSFYKKAGIAVND